MSTDSLTPPPPPLSPRITGPAETYEEKLGLSRAARLPELRGAVTPNQLNRWCTRGVRGAVLKSELIGGRRYVTAYDVRAFLAKLNNRQTAEGPTDDQRRRWVRGRLAAAGI